MRRRIKVVAAVVAAVLTLTMLGGCWDSRELNRWFILTATSLDVTEDPEKIYVTFQIANIKQGESGSAEGGGDQGGGGDNSVITFSIVTESLRSGVERLNADNDNKLLFQHSQIRLFGLELAQSGIKKHLDLLLRDFQARLEVPMAVVDGRAEDVLKTKLPHEPNSGIFLGGFFKDLFERSDKCSVRLIDFTHMLLDGTIAPVMPIIKLSTTENDEKGITFEGMAVFKDDKMIGRLDKDETLGYLFSYGDVHNVDIDVREGQDRAVLNISKLKSKRKIIINSDGSVKAEVEIFTDLNLSESHGFKQFKPPELLKHLEKLAQERIKQTLMSTFSKAKELKADVFGFCTMVQKYHPNEWEKLKGRWDEVFAEMNLDVKVNAQIKGTGQISESLEMEEKYNDNR